MQFCGQGNKTAYLSSYTEAFRWSEKKNIKTANLGSYTDTFRLSENFVDHQNFHIEQFHGHSKDAKKPFYEVTVKLLYMEVLLVNKILAEPKSVRVTAKVSSFDVFFLAPPKSLHVTAKVCSFVALSPKLHWLEVLTTVKL